MDLTSVVCESSDFKGLCQEVQNNSISKSILLFSKDVLYSTHFAKCLAVAIFNNGHFIENEHFAKVSAETHPDLKTYPKKDKLLVSDSEEIVMESYIKPIFADKKVFIIKNIDNSMDSAQNKLLKILEEPPENVYFILTCANSNLVLPTIKSRCNKIELNKLDKQSIEKLLKGTYNLSIISGICEGQIGRALELKNNEDLDDIFNLSFSILKDMKSSKQVLQYSNKIFEFKKDLNLIFEIVSLLLEDLLFFKADKISYMRFKDNIKDFEGILQDYTIKAICEIRKLIDRANKELSFNGNPTLIVENLLMNILEVKYICK